MTITGTLTFKHLTSTGEWVYDGDSTSPITVLHCRPFASTPPPTLTVTATSASDGGSSLPPVTQSP